MSLRYVPPTPVPLSDAAAPVANHPGDPSRAAQVLEALLPGAPPGVPSHSPDPSFTPLAAKLCPRRHAALRAASLPRARVFTNGVFDLLHRGHVECLQQARALGASLIVGLNSDASARLLGKGPERPINPESDRACVLAALEAVSLVVLFDEATPLALLEEIRPEVYVKGGDYDVQRLPEAALMARWGGRALALPYLDGRSTTEMVRRMRAAQ